jgi:hypothetical protein
LKSAEAKLFLLYEELGMLAKLEEKDDELHERSQGCRRERASVMHKIRECQDKLSEKKDEIEHWRKTELGLQKQFTEILNNEDNPVPSTLIPQLLKIYKKKIKRKKRKENEGDSDEDESEEESEEEDDDSGEDGEIIMDTFFNVSIR